LCQEKYKYTYKHIPILILRRCGTSKSPIFGTQRPHWRSSWDLVILGVPTSARWRLSWACARSPHLRLGNDSDTNCNDLPPTIQLTILWWYLKFRYTICHFFIFCFEMFSHDDICWEKSAYFGRGRSGKLSFCWERSLC
jgi:hypothetical protein